MRNTPQTIGIIFDSTRDGDWPTVAEIGRSSWSVAMDVYAYGYVDGEPLADWFAVAHDPTRDRYSDDDHEAMDATNFAAILANLSVEPETLPNDSWPRYEESLADALETGIVYVGKLLAVRPDMTEDIATMVRLRSSLADCPLLDESGYSEREYEAWQAYAPTAISDEIRQAPFDDETSDAVTEATDDDAILASLCSSLDHYHGFTGEYSPDLLTIVAARFAAVLCSPEPPERFTYASPGARLLAEYRAENPGNVVWSPERGWH